MTEELHIAGIVVHTHAEGVDRAAAAIASMSGTEVHAVSPDGKLVVVLEGPGAREIATRLEEIQQLDGVLTASLVYQHSEPLAAMMEEVSP